MVRSETLSSHISEYRRRLGLFSALKALLFGVTAGLFAFGAAVLVMKIINRSGFVIPAVIFAAVFAAAAAAALIFLFPSYNYTAKKLDDLGLKERTSTMLALAGSPTEIAALQRSDALAHLGTVEKKQLRERISTLSIILVLAALIFASVCSIIPAAWFQRTEEKSAEEVWQDVLEMLREEQQRLEQQGEEALSDEMKDLIEKLENSDSILNAIGDINTAEENAVDDVLNGEASPRSAREMIEVLEEAKRMLLDLEEAENAQAGEGEMEIMIPGEGEKGEEGEGQGEEPAEGGEEGEGQGENGEQQPDNAGQKGHGSSEERPDEEERESNKTELIYDPISGTVKYGDVFSVYLSEYLKNSEGGEIPFELKDAADAYFNSLDR